MPTTRGARPDQLGPVHGGRQRISAGVRQPADRSRAAPQGRVHTADRITDELVAASGISQPAPKLVVYGFLGGTLNCRDKPLPGRRRRQVKVIEPVNRPHEPLTRLLVKLTDAHGRQHLKRMPVEKVLSDFELIPVSLADDGKAAPEPDDSAAAAPDRSPPDEKEDEVFEETKEESPFSSAFEERLFYTILETNQVWQAVGHGQDAAPRGGAESGQRGTGGQAPHGAKAGAADHAASTKKKSVAKKEGGYVRETALQRARAEGRSKTTAMEFNSQSILSERREPPSLRDGRRQGPCGNTTWPVPPSASSRTPLGWRRAVPARWTPRDPRSLVPVVVPSHPRPHPRPRPHPHSRPRPRPHPRPPSP